MAEECIWVVTFIILFIPLYIWTKAWLTRMGLGWAQAISTLMALDHRGQNHVGLFGVHKLREIFDTISFTRPECQLLGNKRRSFCVVFKRVSHFITLTHFSSIIDDFFSSHLLMLFDSRVNERIFLPYGRKRERVQEIICSSNGRKRIWENFYTKWKKTRVSPPENFPMNWKYS